MSVVVPAHDEEAALPAFRRELTRAVDVLPCPAEVVMVDDGSRDGTLAALMAWAREDPRVRVVALARNFGHQAAVTAGLDAAAGDAVVVMDADLQDPPAVIQRMIDRYRDGYDVVYGQRSARAGETRMKRLTAWGFYRFMRATVHPDLPADAGDFRLVSRPCLDAVRGMRETHRFLRGMVAWVGFPQTAVRFDRPPRVAGETKYSYAKMVRFALTAAVSFSPAPLRLSMFAGACLAAFGLADGAYAVGRSLLGYHNVPGWTSVMAALCLIGGGILVSIGILGEYVGRIFEQVKGRPLYVVRFTSGASAVRTEAEPDAAETVAVRGWPARAPRPVGRPVSAPDLGARHQNPFSL
ncbi:MAG TPA: glycosyltransferase family 2 protein [Humisphaera sp.]